MPNLDLIEASLTGPMDWGRVELLVFDILTQDDFPRLRKLGGTGDEGADAIEEAFYQNEQRVETVVQITSEKTQLSKFNRTVARLKKCKIEFDQLVIVYRDPVDNKTRRKIRASAAAEDIAVDIRDQSYLVSQLGKLENGIFSRYFEDVKSQFATLLDAGDPLKEADDRLVHAMLVSLAAYVANPTARMVRTTLFDRTVIAVVVGHDDVTTIESLGIHLRTLLPGETADSARLEASLQRLEKEGLCHRINGIIKATDQAVEAIGATLIRLKGIFDRMLGQLIHDVKHRHKLSDAQCGYLDRNLRRALTHLVRLIELTDSIQQEAIIEVRRDEDTFRGILVSGLNQNIARTAVASLTAFVRDEANQPALAALTRAYATMRLRNMDPLGKRWQAANLARSVMLLDTDVVLRTLIEELPEHAPICSSLRSLQSEGVRLIVPLSVLQEAVDHISRAERTFRRFGGSLARMTPDMVENDVWHAIVQGFYHSEHGATVAEFHTYWSKYYDKDNALGFGRFLLENRIACEISDCISIDADDQDASDTIARDVMAKKEPGRLKAEYRAEDEMEERTVEHVAFALFVARLAYSEGRSIPLGYLVSNDTVFRHIQSLPTWGDRPRIHMNIPAVLTLAEWACGIRLTDQQLVGMVFNPVLAAAAEDISKDLLPLAKIGVELRNVDPRRLEWDVKKDLQARLLEYKHTSEASSIEARIESGIALAESAQDMGYKIDPNIGEVVAEYNSVLKDRADEHERRQQAEALAKSLVDAASGLTKKGKRRVNAIIREIGGLPVYTTNLKDR